VSVPHGLEPGLGTIGVAITEATRWPGSAFAPFLAALEERGVGSVWFGENVGGESMATAGLLLAASTSLVVATGVANTAARSPAAMQAGARILGEANPGRFVLGIGASHRAIVDAYGATTSGGPIDHMRTYLEAMAATPHTTAPSPAVPVVIAALGPRMLDLASAKTDGAHPFNVTPAHTVLAREALGRDAWLVPRQAVLRCTQPSEAREIARRHLGRYLTFSNYRRSLAREGFTDEDLADNGSDRLADALVAWGTDSVIDARITEHLAAGADHVVVQPLTASGTMGDDSWFDTIDHIGRRR
jgi:probable F420-dependent oxidoreductase